MMVVEETTGSVFPSDLYLQPGEQPTVTSENLADEMLRAYRTFGVFAREDPVRAVARADREAEPRVGPRDARRDDRRRGVAVLHELVARRTVLYRSGFFGRSIPAEPGPIA